MDPLAVVLFSTASRTPILAGRAAGVNVPHGHMAMTSAFETPSDVPGWCSQDRPALPGKSPSGVKLPDPQHRHDIPKNMAAAVRPQNVMANLIHITAERKNYRKRQPPCQQRSPYSFPRNLSRTHPAEERCCIFSSAEM